MKKAIRIAGVVVGVVILVGGGYFAIASSGVSKKLAQKYETHVADIPVPYPLDEAETTALKTENPNADPIAVAKERAITRGKHLVEARYACNICHGVNFAGGLMLDDPAIGTWRGPNITAGKGGKTAGYKPSDWERIVRHGVKPDGTAAIMPSEDFWLMSDRELSDVIAFITSQPAVDNEEPQPTFGPVGTILVFTGQIKRRQRRKRITLQRTP